MSDYLKKRQDFINAGRPLAEKKKYVIPKVSEKRKAKEKAEKGLKGDSGLDKWFEEMRKRMTGKCLFCGGKTEKSNDDTYRRSIAHLLPKRSVNKGGFPSVSTHEENWIELCFYGNSCHTNFDSGMITWEFLKDSKEWDIIQEKLFTLLPLIPEEERKHKLYSIIQELVYGKK